MKECICCGFTAPMDIFTCFGCGEASWKTVPEPIATKKQNTVSPFAETTSDDKESLLSSLKKSKKGGQWQ
jgi:hypothetical protein